MPPVLDPSERISLVSTGESSRLRRRPAVVLRPPASGPLAIYCGAQDPITAENISEYDYDEHRPWTAQILPDEQLPPSPLKKSRSSRSNGCGAQVHGSVCMMRRNQCWYGSKEELAPTVVPLETFYFPSELVQVLDLSDDRPSACGCVLDGHRVGNPLGAVQTYCAAHSPRGGSIAGPSGYVFASSATPTTVAAPPTDTAPPTPRALPAPPTPTSPGIRFPSSPPGYISFIPPPPPPATVTSFVPSTTTSFVPSTTTSSPSSSLYADAPPSTFYADADASSQEQPVRPRPRRRRTLRTLESVERYFSGSGAGATSSVPVGTTSFTAVSAPAPAPGPGADAGAGARSSFQADLQRNVMQFFAGAGGAAGLGVCEQWGSWRSGRRSGRSRSRRSRRRRRRDARLGRRVPHDAVGPVAPVPLGRRGALEPHHHAHAAPVRALLDASPGPTPLPSSPVGAAAAASETTTRVRDIERHLDVLGVRAAALDAAAANMRQHLEALRTEVGGRGGAVGRSAPPLSPDLQQEAVGAATRAGGETNGAGVAGSATAIAMPGAGAGVLPTTSMAADSTAPSAAAQGREAQARDARTELLISAREMQERLVALGERTSPALVPVPATAAPAPSSAPAPAATSSPALVADIRAIVRDQTALLSRVSGLIADMGARVGALEGTLERVDRTLRRAAPAPAPVPDEAETWRARLAGLSDAVDMDELRSMEADARRLVADAQRAAAA
ncbi:hypothetical protein B0H14DRAFT_2856067, partial [Mycena olivaceomarginata]